MSQRSASSTTVFDTQTGEIFKVRAARKRPPGPRVDISKVILTSDEDLDRAIEIFGSPD